MSGFTLDDVKCAAYGRDAGLSVDSRCSGRVSGSVSVVVAIRALCMLLYRDSSSGCADRKPSGPKACLRPEKCPRSDTDDQEVTMKWRLDRDEIKSFIFFHL